MWTAQSSVGGEHRAHRSGSDSELIELAADGRQQRSKDYRFTDWGPGGSQETGYRDVPAHRGQEFFARAVRFGDEQFESPLIWNSTDESELFAVGGEADAGVYIAHYLLRVTA